MKWNPGWFSAPHSYRTDRICVVAAGTWWVNSGADFTSNQAVPVSAGGFVLRHARTWHYDGVPADAKEPAVIAVFGIGPVDLRLVDPNLLRVHVRQQRSHGFLFGGGQRHAWRPAENRSM